ncbi:MAG: serine--tRNA ligase [Chthoniobacteraceae bacterium]|jgi:seryl-tRNA synthetase
MLDIRLIREKPDFVKERLSLRGGDAAALVDQVLACDADRRALETQLQRLNGERKRISKEIGVLRANGENTSAIEAQVRAMGDDIALLNQNTADADTRQRDLLLQIPNLPHPAAPVGANAETNPVVRIWGEKPPLSAPRSHIDIGAELGLFDLERAARMSGSAFACFTGAGARLERALINFMLDLHTGRHGYLEVSPPFVIRKEALIGTGQLPKFEEQLYRCERDELYLAPTAEVPVTNLYREEILSPADLPKNFVAYTPCFRREAGSAGLGTRGLIRVHQFDKVELVKLTTPEASYAELESLTAHAEKVLQILGLHYRVIELCTGDLGFGGAKTYDIEVWAPGQNAYLEVSSCTNFEDFQARRLNLRFKDADGKNRFCHTLNGSGTALPRIYVAILETCRQADGSILIPEALRRHFGAEKISKP